MPTRRYAADLWEDVARPTRPLGVPGVTMAGFRGRGTGVVDLVAVPHPAVMIGIEFGSGRLVTETPTGGRQRGSLAAGFVPGPVRVRAPGVECVQVRLSPVAAHAMLRIPPTELSHTVIALEDLWGPEAGRLEDRLRATSSWDDRFGLVEAALARCARRGPAFSPEVAHAWSRIVAGRGLLRVDDLAGEVGWSRKRLWSRFRAQIGISPKRAAKLARFDHAAHRLAAGISPARVAAETGYADQSHLHREVRDFIRMTPAAVAGQPWLAVDELAWPTRRR